MLSVISNVHSSKLVLKPSYPAVIIRDAIAAGIDYFAVHAGSTGFNVDGFVFTPVHEKYPKRVDARPTWKSVIKWKPLSHLTIDFMIKMRGNVAELHVAKGDRHIPFLVNGVPQTITFLENELPLSLDGNIIYNGGVYECSYATGAWKVFKYRPDKSAQGHANGLITANNVMREIEHFTPFMSIFTPFSREYFGEINQKIKDLSDPLRKVHSAVVRDVLCRRALTIADIGVTEPVELLDLGAGKGGDMAMWFKYCNSVVACDISHDNLFSKTIGLVAKLERERTFPQNKTMNARGFHMKDLKVVPIEIDLSKPMDIGVSASSVAKLHAIKPHSQSLIMCNYMIHYFFDKPASLTNLINTIDTFSKSGSVVVITYLDAVKVATALAPNGTISGVLVRGGKSHNMWGITKTSTTLQSTVFGREIKVFMASINEKVYSEFLVDDATLVTEFARIGFECVGTGADAWRDNGSYGNIYKHNKAVPEYQPFITTIEHDTNAPLLTLSQLYKYMVMKKK
jgi:SAM-dependent methyltransferase